jgi:hypothetical protein
LTAILSSPITQYFLFHTTANIGIERDVARAEEILAIPFPLPEDLPHPEMADSILHRSAERLRKLQTDLRNPNNLLKGESLVSEAQGELNELVFAYFEVSDWERKLISDTIEIFRKSSTPGSLDSDTLITTKYSKLSHRREYAETLSKTFHRWSQSGKTLQAHCTVADALGLGLITFEATDQTVDYTEEAAEDQVASLLKTLHERAITERRTTWQYIRGFVYYQPNQVNILKPLSRRHWTSTAALNDADEILTRMMEESGWRA